jgi:hypothetical protein
VDYQLLMHLIPKGFLSLPPSGASLLIPTTRTNSDPCFAVKNQTYAKRCVSRPALKFETYKSLSLHQQYQKIDVLSHRQYQSSGTIFVHLVVGIRCNGRKKKREDEAYDAVWNFSSETKGKTQLNRDTFAWI